MDEEHQLNATDTEKQTLQCLGIGQTAEQPDSGLKLLIDSDSRP
jgi:hypothetical protein